MVGVVLLMTNDKTRFLQEPDDWMRLGIDHVRPFVNFVCEDRQHKTEDNCPIPGLRYKRRTVGKIAEIYKEGYRIR